MTSRSGYNVAVVGATGTVGTVFFELFEDRNFPILNLYPLASERSLGESIFFKGKSYPVLQLDSFDFSDVDIAFFSAGSAVSELYAKKAALHCLVIDNTSFFRQVENIPLVVPEINPHAILYAREHNIIANPNCSTIQMLVALKPIYDQVGISRINVTTFQSVSGSGKEAITELATQTTSLLNGQSILPKVFPRQIAFNVVPQIDIFMENGFTKEEMKMHWETQKIFEDSAIMVNATAVRVPVFYGHSAAVHIETSEKITVETARKLLKNAPGVKLIDNRKNGGYPTPVTDAAGTDSVYVGRLREDLSHPNGLNLWIVSDNVRKGAALNSIQIAELYAKQAV